MKRPVFYLATPCLVLMLLLGTAVHATAQHSLSIPLTEFSIVGKPLLQGKAADFRVSIPTPQRWNVTSANLRFPYVNSTGLLGDRSRLIVRFNDQVLAQVELLPESPEGLVTVPIPTTLLKPRFNELQFAVAQDYDGQCTDPGNPTLWTHVSVERAFLDVSYTLKPVPMFLSSIADFLFDPKQFNENRVHLVVPDYSPEMMNLASIAASGTSLRFEFRQVKFTLSQDLRQGMDNILIGDKLFVAGVLDQYERTPPQNDFGIMPLPGPAPVMPEDENNQEQTELRRFVDDHTRAIIVLSGEDINGVTSSTKAFSVLSFPLPDISSSDPGSVIIPEITRETGKNLITPGQKYTLDQLGMPSHTFTDMYPIPENMTVRLPSDALLPGNLFARLALHLAYGTQMRQDSVINIHLNGRFIAGVPLSNPQGGRYGGYQIHIPMYYFRPGLNTFTFEPVLTPLITDLCTFIQLKNLFVTIFDDSTLSFPELDHWVEMPELALFMEDGFPFTSWPDWRENAIVVPPNDPLSSAAAVNIVAMTSQKTGIAPYRVQFLNEPPQQPLDILVVSPYPDISPQIMQATPMAPRLAYPWQGVLQGSKEQSLYWWNRIMADIFPERPRSVPQPSVHAEAIEELVMNSDKLLLTQSLSPYAPMRTLMVATARSPEALLQGANAMSNPLLQGQARGSVVLADITDLEFGVRSQHAGERYFVGDLGSFRWFTYIVNTYPFWFFGTLMVILTLTAFVIRRLLRTRLKAKEQE
ncbi:cellulose biosynthesis cyclic di-GMP-binding regulatory protein BcsB [Desulfonatronovibrio magnus]|uniref:cellulose biosynthesis cyclic di-GMP-binding regulatory protein BcsB n=1 Tax=Desulfonatronovibrio magnus TaxID=698827 RepID=UPI0005EAD40C|nr:cellulose biosynthesis cyclic di-GMP-binding regulatory protein BcsB [Desulfonatronovibrio magnus]